MNVMIAGGTGMIGAALSRALVKARHSVWALTRSPKKTKQMEGVAAVEWDGIHLGSWVDTFSQMDAIVNLAGETIGAYPWSEDRKRRIRASRVDAGVALTSAFEKISPHPKVLIQSSGIGYYGKSIDDVVTEDSPAGKDFSAGVAVDWEASTRIIDSLGVRRVIIRQAIVLSRREGILPLMSLPVRLFAGGRLGSGRQGLPWIHIDDTVGAIQFLLENDRARGAFNLCAPNTPSNAVFMQTLCQTLARPYWLHIPDFALRLALGQMSELLLNGQFAIPQRLAALGYAFKYQTLSDALDAVYNPDPSA
jgi:hypothetical protein